MKTRLNRMTVAVITITGLAALSYVTHYAVLWTTVPWPGGEGGRGIMQESFFIGSRLAFYHQQTPFIAGLLTALAASMMFLQPDRSSAVQKTHYWLQAGIGVLVLATPALWILGWLALTGITVLNIGLYFAIGWRWRSRWLHHAPAFFLSIAAAGWSYWYCDAWFGVYGD